MHKMDLKVGYNAILHKHPFMPGVHAAVHNDDLPASGRPDEEWGRLIDKGVDLIQNDWPAMLRQYMLRGCHKKNRML